MRTTIDVDDAVLRDVKVIAARSGRTVSAVVNDVLRVGLAADAGPAGHQPVILPVDGRGGLQPGVDLDDRGAIARLLGDDDPA